MTDSADYQHIAANDNRQVVWHIFELFAQLPGRLCPHYNRNAEHVTRPGADIYFYRPVDRQLAVSKITPVTVACNRGDFLYNEAWMRQEVGLVRSSCLC